MSDKEGTTAFSHIEQLKIESKGLYVPIAEDLGSASSTFSEASVNLLKQHGVYQQENRDARRLRKQSDQPPDARLMVRAKVPGGRLSADQYLVLDSLATEYGQNDLRVTSRQGVQIHGVQKHHLRTVLHEISTRGNITTYGSSGDVLRNVAVSPVADIDPQFRAWGKELLELAGAISKRYMPQAKGYFELWVNDKAVQVRPDHTIEFLSEPSDEDANEPFYTRSYLPRKFKVAIAADFDNSVDVLTNDIGLIAVTTNGSLEGYDLVVGGGLGFTPGRISTLAQLAASFSFIRCDQVFEVLDAIVGIFRDHGNRTDRSHARLKYLIQDWGWERFRSEVAGRVRFPLIPPRGILPTAQLDYLGWNKQSQNGLNYLGIRLENGRIRDFPNGQLFKTGLRAAIRVFRPEIRFTPQHNLILANIHNADVPDLARILDAHNIPSAEDIAPLRRFSMACPALPYCSRAISEAERMMPRLMNALIRMGHGDAEVTIRATGCANGCARTRTAEIGIIGRTPDSYRIYVGGDPAGGRLNDLLLEKVAETSLMPVVCGLLTRWKENRMPNESFGVWANRRGVEDISKELEQDVSQTGAK